MTRTLILLLNPTQTPHHMWISGGMGLGFSLEAADSDKIWITTKVILTNHICLRDKSQSPPPPVPVRIAKYAPNYSSSCLRGRGDLWSHLHTWWDCPVPKHFWKDVFFMISTLFEIPINPDQSWSIVINRDPTSTPLSPPANSNSYYRSLQPQNKLLPKLGNPRYY